jgi:hypothetical protein
MPSRDKKIFISYSHEDRQFAQRLANALHNAGEEVWWDQWEVAPGDSLIRKIFEEGLANASAFVVILSPRSVNSRWVREELDVATVQRIEGVTRLIPVMIEKTEIPTSLRSLLWLDMREDVEGGVKKIINAVHGVSSKPPRSATSISKKLSAPIAGLSRAASQVGLVIVGSTAGDSRPNLAFSGQDLEDAAGMDPPTLNDAVGELEAEGMVKTIRALGSHPYEFAFVEPTYVLFREFTQHLPYDPENDIRYTAAAIAALGTADGKDLEQQTELPPERLNRAVAYLDEYGLATVHKFFGTHPYTFGHVAATRRTRQFVDSAS